MRTIMFKATPRNTVLLLCATSIILTMFVLLFTNQIEMPNDISDKFIITSLSNTTQNDTTRYILLWTTFYDVWKTHPLASSCSSNPACIISNDRNILTKAHAIVFHCRDLDMTDMPQERLPHQKWVFFCLEPPPYSFFLGFRFMRNMFNWTMTYRRDSDVSAEYGTYRKIDKTRGDIDKSVWSNKTGVIYWMVSHCNTFSKRENFVAELGEFVDIDMYGKCGIAVCPRNKTLQCQTKFSSKYKFVLAFENSLCKDYVTEKFFEALKLNIVPIVFGNANYAALAPPNSYINALDFKTIKELANHLINVATNESLYNSYLDWKTKFVVEKKNYICDLCAKLLSAGNDYSVYEDISNWWVDGSSCYIWKKL